MDMKIMTPTQIFINDKWFCTAQSVEITEKPPKKGEGITPNTFTGKVVRITRTLPRPEKEKKANKKTLKKIESYDEFFSRMVKAIDDPGAHTPVDLDVVQR